MGLGYALAQTDSKSGVALRFPPQSKKGNCRRVIHKKRRLFWTAPAKRSGDGAFECNGRFQSGVAPASAGLPPQSKFAAVTRRFAGLNNRCGRMNSSQPVFKLA